MTNPFPRLNRRALKTLSVVDRPIIVNKDKIGKIRYDGDTGYVIRDEFFECLPKQLASKDLLTLINAILDAKENKRAVIFMLGGHVIKTGVSPYIVDLIEEGYITHIAMNGSAAIHDWELAVWNGTSEDVASGLEDGSFGMVKETPSTMQETIELFQGAGIGYQLGNALYDYQPYKSSSILLACSKMPIGCTVHPSFETETLVQYPDYDAQLWAKEALNDFDQFAEHLVCLDEGGVIINIGSAVVMPETFLKALTMCRNIHGGRPKNFISADFDMLHQYRPTTNVVNRPTNNKGIIIRGHHEIMIPLLTWGIRSYGSLRGV